MSNFCFPSSWKVCWQPTNSWQFHNFWEIKDDGKDTLVTIIHLYPGVSPKQQSTLFTGLGADDKWVMETIPTIIHLLVAAKPFVGSLTLHKQKTVGLAL